MGNTHCAHAHDGQDYCAHARNDLKFKSELSNIFPPILSIPLECTEDVEIQLSAGMHERDS